VDGKLDLLQETRLVDRENPVAESFQGLEFNHKSALSPMVCRIFTVDLPDNRATLSLGQQLGRHSPAGTVLLLSGDLGSGKTTLVQGIGSGLGIIDAISSPTFTLINEYPEGRIPLYHIDLYRLAPEEVNQLNLDLYWDEWERPLGIVAIEWSERLTTFPPGAVEIQLVFHETGGRQAILSAHTDLQIDLLEKATRHALLVDEI
jgi:tRNA threonylcarbamoyladenosine biosynthesis protein TsaE